MTPTLKQVQAIIGLSLPSITYSYSERDVCLYALGVGAPSDWLDQSELQFVYELSTLGFKTLPSFATLFPGKLIDILLTGRIGEIEFNPLMVVHGEQVLRFKGLLPTSGTIHCQPIISAVYDKGSGMVIVVDTPCYDASGIELVFNQSTMFIRGMGGFGGDRGPSGEITTMPEREPDFSQTDYIQPNQALLYRLSGDVNPLHADPQMAAFAGFDRPILHGLSTFGFATRVTLKKLCNNDPARLKSIRARFSKHVFPGETLVTDLWHLSDGHYGFTCKVAERNELVLSQGQIEIS
ncbi:MAG TPA: MaoC/PaaZ C-terminal domain-containing protein [Aggregatilineales bacterium]|nr:MaoC/PaaZ C-terminal domain-containing protein [Aggregatilineales bacterium]